jgi:hypothetical protein
VAKFDRVIPPGQEGKVELAIDGDKVHGEFTKGATIDSNDPENPHLKLEVTGKAISYLDVQPEGTVYLHGRFGEAAEQDLTLTTNEKDLDLKVMGVRSNIDDKITYSVDPGTAPGTYTLKVFKNPKLPTLSTYGTITVTTNSKRAPETTMQVHVMTKGSITPSPSILNYGAVKFTDDNGPGTPETKALTVTRAGLSFKIRDVAISNSNFKATVDTVSPGQQYRIQVTFTPPVLKKARQAEVGEMIIHTDDPKEPAVRVQLMARAQ